VIDQAPLTAWDRRRRRARRELAAVAVRLFDERGFTATTVADIVAAAEEYSESTFFRLFPRKEDAVFFDIPGRLEEFREASLALGPAPGWKDIRALLLDHAKTWEQTDPEFANARVRLFGREPSLRSRYLEYASDYEQVLAATIARSRDGDPATDAFCITVAGALVAAFRAAFTVQAQLGGSVAHHLNETCDILESRFLRDLSLSRRAS
jgi:AcrR family transcriptional regulator